ncbi:MAG TPA: 4Fe-4S ferredoxin [Clostridiales bacterium]|nr:4Fe-4S ferredoxin [Clostridiales bacterium]
MIEIRVFSGTGNTLKCAERMKDRLMELGEECVLSLIESGKEILSALPDTLIVGYPIHGFNMPYNVMDFVKGLPSVKGTPREKSVKVYFLKSSGEPLRINNNSSHAAAKILKKKGYVVLGEFHYVMPYNMIFRHTDELAAKMYLAAKKRVVKDAETIARGEEHFIKRTFGSLLASGVCKVERPGMRFSGRFFKVDEKKCVHCGKCEKSCPVGNIKIKDGKFTFGKMCVGCMRCSFLCPTDAFTIGIMNCMRVNKKYDFNADASKAEICNYCKKSYERYFLETETKY